MTNVYLLSYGLRVTMLIFMLATMTGYIYCFFTSFVRTRKVYISIKYGIMALLTFVFAVYFTIVHNEVIKGSFDILPADSFVFKLGNFSGPLYVFFVLAFFGLLLLAIIHEQGLIRKTLNEQSIIKGVNNMPFGICFSDTKGLPYFTNLAMYDAVRMVTGDRIFNVKSLWNKLSSFSNRDDCVKVGGSDSLVFKSKMGKTWEFDKSIININGEEIIQLTATDVTKLDIIADELKNKRESLNDYRKKLQRMMENIVETQKEEEILSSKVKIHDNLGRAAIMTGWRVWDKEREVDEQMLIDSWSDIILKMKVGFDDEVVRTDPLTELKEASASLGCGIEINGQMPRDTDLSYIIVSAAREAVTNAIRHAKANKVFVDIEEELVGIRVKVYDNGESKDLEILEGTGLKSLRRTVEKAAGEMNTFIENHKFYIEMKLPL